MEQIKSTTVQAEQWTAILFRVRGLLRRYWWILLLTTVIGLGVAAGLASRQETWYRSTARLIVSGRVHVTEGNAYSEDGANFFGTQAELMKSSQVTGRAETRIKAAGTIALAPVSALEVGLVPNTSIFSLQVTAKTPEYSQAYLEALIEEFTAFKRGMRDEKSETTVSSITDELLVLEKDWKSTQEELVQFEQEHSLLFLHEGENSAAKYAAGLSERIASLSTQLRLLERLDLDQLRSLDPDTKKTAASQGDRSSADFEIPAYIAQSDYLKCRQSLQLLEEKKSELSQNLRAGHPDLVEVEEQLSAQRRLLTFYKSQVQEEMDTERKSLTSQIAALGEELDDWKKKALESAGLIAEHSKLQAKLDNSKSFYDRLAANVSNIGLSKNLDQDVISVLEKPSVAVPIRPGVERLLGSGATLGLLVGMAVLFLLDRSKAEIASPGEYLANFNERILGMVPAEGKASDRLQVSDKRHAFAEAFYNIRSSLFFLPYEGPMPKTLLITSAVPNEGKSTLSTNIALAFAFAGSKCLLIDGDLRRGQIHKAFEISSDRGLSDVLQRKAEWREVIYPTDVQNLSVMPRGGVIAQPSKYLVHASTDALLRELYEEFDHIIIDSCPVLAADDTTSLAPKVEAVIVVVRLEQVTHRHLNLTLGALRSRQANVLGVVLNGVDTRATSYKYHSYGEYYGATQPAVETA